MKKINVGVALQGDPQKGITLIALIITIIVMLILVGVTINVALNGGLFEKAKTASEQTQRETDKEQLISAVISTVDNNGDFHLDQIKLPDGFEKTPEGRYKNTNNNKEYTVDQTTGKVEEYTGTNSVGGAGGQVTYLDYNANPLPKFTLNDNQEDLANLLDPTKNTDLSNIMEYNKGDYECNSTFTMFDSGPTCMIIGEYCVTEDGKYYIQVIHATTSGRYVYYYSLENITLGDNISITGGSWNKWDEDENEVTVVGTYPIFEGMELKDNEGNVEPSKTNANNYYQKLFVVVDD